MRLQDKTALVTGASSGIGRETAKALAAEGAMLAVSGRRPEPLEALAEEVVSAGGRRPIVLIADLSLPGAAAMLANDATASLGSIDILVNNAAIEGNGSYAAADPEEARKLFETNYWSPMALAQAVIPQMSARGSGTIVNVSSLGAITPIPDTGHYPSSKSALAVATESLRSELAGSGVHVVLVYPGLVETPMLRAFRERPGLPAGTRRSLRRMPIGRPQKLAGLIVSAIRRQRKTVVYPRSFAPTLAVPIVSRWVTARLFPTPGHAPPSRPCRLRTLCWGGARCLAPTGSP